jgi:hypothetical protein
MRGLSNQPSSTLFYLYNKPTFICKKLKLHDKKQSFEIFILYIFAQFLF